MKNDSMLNILEILDLAKKIEESGEKFYRKAATTYSKHNSFLLALAEQEKGHGAHFNMMKERQIKEGNLQNNGEKSSIKEHLDAIADGLIFDSDKDLERFFSHEMDAEEIMDAAIEREEDTILFFQEIKKLLPGKKDKKIMSDLIAEEESHIEWICEQKKALPFTHPLL